MRIYLAAPFAARDLAAGLAYQLEALGHECTSTWAKSTRVITSPGLHGPTLDLDSETVRMHALGDFDDIERADAVFMLTADWCMHNAPEITGPLHSGGRQVEIGYALATGTRVIIIGEPENIFQRTLCDNASNLHGALEELS